MVEAALQQAIERRRPAPGTVHHSDQGVQYACKSYREMLRTHGLVPSMSRPANPYDNAVCESFMKTLKQEEIYCNQYRDFEELLRHLEEFLDAYYNRQRLHSALGYRTPEEFEQAAEKSDGTAGATMKYFAGPESSSDLGDAATVGVRQQ